MSGDLIIDDPETRLEHEAPHVLSHLKALNDMLASEATSNPDVKGMPTHMTLEDLEQLREEVLRLSDYRMMTAGDIADLVEVAGSNVYGMLRDKEGNWKVRPVMKTKAGLLWRRRDIEHWNATRPRRKRRRDESS